MYAEDPDSLIAIGHVVALELATIAAANNYRR
ncbi:hexameric tyrosine-coordinated heme protein [Streptomyces capitiformicae]|nr:hexameric tyrosine-coordinated heme protein [Streptomyces capitiformicae]